MSRGMIATAIALALAGCGGGGSGSGSGTDGGNTPPPVIGGSHLVVTSSGPAAPVPGGRVTEIDVVVSNTGTAASAAVAITSTLDPLLTLIEMSCTAAGGAVCPAKLAEPVQVSSLPASGSVTLHLALAPGSDLSGMLTSTFHVASTDLPGGQQDSTADIHVTSAYVHVEETVPRAPVPLGGVAVFTTTITNPGPDSAPDLQLSHEFESTMAIGSVTCQAQGGTPCPAALGAHVTIPNLGVGDKLIFTVPMTVQSSASGRAVDVVRLQRDGLPIDRYNEVIASAFVYAGPSPSQNAVHIVNDPGTADGGGLTYDFISANSGMSIANNDNEFELLITADELWRIDFRLPASQSTIQPGTYNSLPYGTFNALPPNQTNAAGGFGTIGGKFTCGGGVATQLTIDSVTYTGSAVSAIDFRFDEACNDSTAHLHGTVHWTAADATKPAGPWQSAPADLWQPPLNATPATGNYVYLQSEIGDFVGNGTDTDYDHTFGYTQADAIIDVSESAGNLTLAVTGNTNWTGQFDVMSGQSQISTGLYPALVRPTITQPTPLYDTAVGGFQWFGDGRACNAPNSWVMIDSVRYSGGQLTALDARFEQRCAEFSYVPLHGKIHWDKSDPTRPPPPITPAPADLWQPAPDATPSQGNYVYLQADPENGIGADGGAAQSTSTAVWATLDSQAHHLHVTAGPLSSGDFQAMNSIADLQVGYYANATRFPMGNPTKGMLSWDNNGRACNAVAGWFAIDSISVLNGVVQSLDLRFEERCDGYAPALHGKIHIGP